MFQNISMDFYISCYPVFAVFFLLFFLTACNSSCGKVMFSQACVIPSVHWGAFTYHVIQCLPCFFFCFSFTARNSSCGKVMFSQACVIPSVHGGGGDLPPQHASQVIWPREGGCIPPALWDTVNKRAVRILLECILVCLGFFLPPPFEQKLTKKAGTLYFEKSTLRPFVRKEISRWTARECISWFLLKDFFVAHQTKWLRIIMKSVLIAKKIIEIVVRTPQGECTPLFLGLPYPIFYSSMAAAPIQRAIWYI